MKFRRYLSNHYTSLAILLRRSGRAAEAAETARSRLAHWPDGPAEDLYNAACELALCIPAVASGRSDPSPAERDERHRYADEAMAALRRSGAAGFRDVDHYRRDTDLDPLRSRPDFAALLLDMAFPTDPFQR